MFPYSQRRLPTCSQIPADTHNQPVSADVQVIALEPVFPSNLFACSCGVLYLYPVISSVYNM